MIDLEQALSGGTLAEAAERLGSSHIRGQTNHRIPERRTLDLTGIEKPSERDLEQISKLRKISIDGLMCPWREYATFCSATITRTRGAAGSLPTMPDVTRLPAGLMGSASVAMVRNHVAGRDQKVTGRSGLRRQASTLRLLFAKEDPIPQPLSRWLTRVP